MRQLTFEAITSDSSRIALEKSWIEVECLLEKSSPRQEDRDFLAAISCNHNAIASMMVSSEALLENLMSEARQQLDNSATCKYRKYFPLT
jgi:hypothetical protein